MEPIEWAAILFAIIAAAQGVDNHKTHKQLDKAETELAASNNELKKALEVNESNAIAINTVRSVANQCAADLIETRKIKLAYEADILDRTIRIEELEDLLNSNDWSRVRVPSSILDSINE